MVKHGITEVAGAPLPKWRPQDSIAVMDTNRIATAILSLSAPGVHFGDGEAKARDLARRCNEFAAGLVQQFPGRFGSFAVLPMPFTHSACEEAIHALDVLNADGVVLLGSTDGVFLGDRRFDELMSELDRRKSVVFVHPNLHASSMQTGLDMPGFLLEFVCDTTRAAVNLILSGTIARHPNIRFILAHAGGFLPYIAWRISLANALPQYAQAEPNGILRAIRNFYYDTALSPSPYAMAALKALIDPSHLMFGSDFPFAPAQITGVQTRELERSPVWDADARHGIDRDHALALFPRLAITGEHIAAPASWRRSGLRENLRRTAHGLAVSVAERLLHQ